MSGIGRLVCVTGASGFIASWLVHLLLERGYTAIATVRNLGADVVVDETWFSDPEFCKEMEIWYALLKTLGETAAWKSIEENGIDLVVLHSSLMVGPLLQATLNFLSDLFLNIVKENAQNGPYRFIDVRDPAYAHIAAFENPMASRRSLSCGVENPTFDVSKPKAERLGISFTPLEVSFRDTVESLKAKTLSL